MSGTASEGERSPAEIQEFMIVDDDRVQGGVGVVVEEVGIVEQAAKFGPVGR